MTTTEREHTRAARAQLTDRAREQVRAYEALCAEHPNNDEWRIRLEGARLMLRRCEERQAAEGAQ